MLESIFSPRSPQMSGMVVCIIVVIIEQNRKLFRKGMIHLDSYSGICNHLSCCVGGSLVKYT